MSFTFIIPFYEAEQELSGQIEALQAAGEAVEILVFDERTARSESRALQAAQTMPGVRYFPHAHRNRAALFNDGIRMASNALVCTLPPDIYPLPGFVAAFAEAFAQNDTAIAYSDYLIEEAGKPGRTEKLWPLQNNIDERFSLGYFRVYRKSAVVENGGFNEDLDYAEEYDFRLRIQNARHFIHLDQPLYRSVVRQVAAVDPALSKLHSPGQGAKGGFSYLFYTPEMEREIEYAFKDFLKRQNCFLTHENQQVAYSADEQFETMVSVVIPILNRKHFIRKTIDTVLRGTFDNFEIIVVDNWSTDGPQDEVSAISG